MSLESNRIRIPSISINHYQSIGQTTGMGKLVNRTKIDSEFQKMGIIRKYDPKLRLRQTLQCNQDDEELAKDVGQLAVQSIKRKIQIDWESEISDQLEKERRRRKELEKRKQKQLEQIDKDFEKIMKKRKVIKDQQILLKSQQSMISVQSYQHCHTKTPKKIQKRNKIQRKTSQKHKQKNGFHESEIQSCSVLNNHKYQYSQNGQLMQNQQKDDKINNLLQDKIDNLLQASDSNHWKHIKSIDADYNYLKIQEQSLNNL